MSEEKFKCVAKGCLHQKVKYHWNNVCTLFKFPTNENKKQLWLQLIQYEGPVDQYAMVCSCHFPEGLRTQGPLLGPFKRELREKLPRRAKGERIRFVKRSYRKRNNISYEEPEQNAHSCIELIEEGLKASAMPASAMEVKDKEELGSLAFVADADGPMVIECYATAGENPDTVVVPLQMDDEIEKNGLNGNEVYKNFSGFENVQVSNISSQPQPDQDLMSTSKQRGKRKRKNQPVASQRKVQKKTCGTKRQKTSKVVKEKPGSKENNREKGTDQLNPSVAKKLILTCSSSSEQCKNDPQFLKPLSPSDYPMVKVHTLEPQQEPWNHLSVESPKSSPGKGSQPSFTLVSPKSNIPKGIINPYMSCPKGKATVQVVPQSVRAHCVQSVSIEKQLLPVHKVFPANSHSLSSQQTSTSTSTSQICGSKHVVINRSQAVDMSKSCPNVLPRLVCTTAEQGSKNNDKSDPPVMIDSQPGICRSANPVNKSFLFLNGVKYQVVSSYALSESSNAAPVPPLVGKERVPNANISTSASANSVDVVAPVVMKVSTSGSVTACSGSWTKGPVTSDAGGSAFGGVSLLPPASEAAPAVVTSASASLQLPPTSVQTIIVRPSPVISDLQRGFMLPPIVPGSLATFVSAATQAGPTLLTNLPAMTSTVVTPIVTPRGSVLAGGDSQMPTPVIPTCKSSSSVVGDQLANGKTYTYTSANSVNIPTFVSTSVNIGGKVLTLASASASSESRVMDPVMSDAVGSAFRTIPSSKSVLVEAASAEAAVQSISTSTSLQRENFAKGSGIIENENLKKTTAMSSETAEVPSSVEDAGQEVVYRGKTRIVSQYVSVPVDFRPLQSTTTQPLESHVDQNQPALSSSHSQNLPQDSDSAARELRDSEIEVIEFRDYRNASQMKRSRLGTSDGQVNDIPPTDDPDIFVEKIKRRKDVITKGGSTSRKRPSPSSILMPPPQKIPRQMLLRRPELRFPTVGAQNSSRLLIDGTKFTITSNLNSMDLLFMSMARITKKLSSRHRCRVMLEIGSFICQMEFEGNRHDTISRSSSRNSNFL